MVGKRQTMKVVAKRDEKKKKKIKAHKRNKHEKREAALKELADKQKAVESMCATYEARKQLFQRFASRSTKPSPPSTPTKCPECDYKMSRNEVEDGFLEDPYDFTTCCPECNYRFITMSIYPVTKRQQDVVVRLCKEQTQEAVSRWADNIMVKCHTELLSRITTQPMLVWNILYHGEPEDGASIWKILNRWFPGWELGEEEEEEEPSPRGDDSSSELSFEEEEE